MPEPDLLSAEMSLPTTQLIETVESVWGIPLQPAGCPACQQVHLVTPTRLGQACPNCGRGRLAAQPALLRPEPPELMLAFRVPRPNLLAIFTNFTKGVWLACDDFTNSSLLSRTAPVFWPMWLLDSNLSGDWQAEMGYDYQVKSSKEYYNSGSWRSREEIETRIRWEPRLGLLVRHYDNISTPAISSHAGLMARLGNYHLDQAVPYKPELIGRASLRVPDLQPENAWSFAQSNLNRAAAEECRQAASAQHVRNFATHASYHKLNWTQQLLPMYVSFYTDDAGKPHMVTINGENGNISGVRLASQRKGWRVAGISAAIAAVTFIVALLAIALGKLVPPIAALGALMFVLAFGIGLFAIIPAVYPWQHNRSQLGPKITTK